MVDPAIPDALLPVDWVGDRARSLAAEIYAGCAERADGRLRAAIAARGGPPEPLPAGWLTARFATDGGRGDR